MLDAKSARKMTPKVIEQAIVGEKNEERLRFEAFFQEERQKNPRRIKEAEEAVKRAKEYRVILDHYLVFMSDLHTLENLIPPHRELYDLFKNLGYTVSLDFDCDQGSYFYGFRLNW